MKPPPHVYLDPPNHLSFCLEQMMTPPIICHSPPANTMRQNLMTTLYSAYTSHGWFFFAWCKHNNFPRQQHRNLFFLAGRFIFHAARGTNRRTSRFPSFLQRVFRLEQMMTPPIIYRYLQEIITPPHHLSFLKVAPQIHMGGWFQNDLSIN